MATTVTKIGRYYFVFLRGRDIGPLFTPEDVYAVMRDLEERNCDTRRFKLVLRQLAQQRGLAVEDHGDVVVLRCGDFEKARIKIGGDIAHVETGLLGAAATYPASPHGARLIFKLLDHETSLF